MRRQLLGIAVALALVAAVVAIVVVRTCCGPPEVRGLIGTEKQDFFQSADVQRDFRHLGFAVTTHQAGSWQMGQEAHGYDFAIPASAVAAASLQGTATGTTVFYSPMVLLTNSNVANFLSRHGLASQVNGTWIFKIDQYVADIQQGKSSWQQIGSDADSAGLSGQAYITTTDPTKSSGASLLVAILSYLANNQHVVQPTDQTASLTPLLYQLLGAQGMPKDTNDQLFHAWSVSAATPLSWTYESEAAALAIKGQKQSDDVVLYPNFDIQSDHTLVPLTPNAAKVADALRSYPPLITQEAHYGFRPATDPTALATALGTKDPDHEFAADLNALQAVIVSPPTPGVLQKLAAEAMSGKPS
jgi:hypothetical protein